MKELKDIIKCSPFGWKLVFWLCFCIASTLIITSFILPPRGVIDPSALHATGEILAFPTIYAAYECIMKGIGIKYSKGNTTIEVEGKIANKQ